MKLPLPPITLDGQTLIRNEKRTAPGATIKLNGKSAKYLGIFTDRSGTAYAKCLQNGGTTMRKISEVA